MRRKAASLGLCAALGLGMAGCPAPQKIASKASPSPTPTSTPSPTPPPTVQGIAIASTSVTLDVPYGPQDVGLAAPTFPVSESLGGTLRWSDGTTTAQGILWTSSDPQLVSVSSSGVVRALVADLAGVGSAVITGSAAASSSLVATASVAVVFPAWSQGVHFLYGAFGGTTSIAIPFAPYTGSLSGTGSL